MKSHLFCVYHKRIQSLLQKFHNGVDTSVKTFPVDKKKKRVWKAYTDDRKLRRDEPRLHMHLYTVGNEKLSLLKYKHAWYSK